MVLFRPEAGPLSPASLLTFQLIECFLECDLLLELVLGLLLDGHPAHDLGFNGLLVPHHGLLELLSLFAFDLFLALELLFKPPPRTIHCASHAIIGLHLVGVVRSQVAAIGCRSD